MEKLLLISVVVCTVAIPIWASKRKSPRRSLQLFVAASVGFSLFYVLSLRFLYHRLL